jgi:hypothetical protein
MAYPGQEGGRRKMMRPEAGPVTARPADFQAFEGYVGPAMPKVDPMYAEVAARVHLEPFFAAEPPVPARGVWARLRAALRHPEARRAVPEAGWTVAAAPIVAKDVPGGKAGKDRAAELLAGLPLLVLAERR